MASIILITGLALAMVMQLTLAFIAITTSLRDALFCLFVPFYVFIFARRSGVNPWFMRMFYLGIGLFVLGAVLASQPHHP